MKLLALTLFLVLIGSIGSEETRMLVILAGAIVCLVALWKLTKKKGDF